jgi:hypothetical protein
MIQKKFVYDSEKMIQKKAQLYINVKFMIEK